MEQNQNNKESELNNKKEQLRKQALNFLFQMIAIIGIPAFLAAYFGKRIGVERGTHPQTMIILMFLALIFSWIIIFIRIFQFKKEFQKVNQERNKNKEQ